jgi:hypothetical protein
VDPGYEVVVGNTSDGALHLAEFNHGDPASPSVVFAKASPGGPTEMYLASIDPGVGALAEAGFLLHLRADSGTTPPNMELTLGGQSPYAKVSCGVQLRSNGTVIYAEGSFKDTHDGTGAETPCEEPIAFCADAVDLTEVLLAECVDAGIYGFELTTLSSETVDMAQVRSLATTVIGDGLTAFDDLAQVE